MDAPQTTERQPATGDTDLIHALLSGDESAFEVLVTQHHAAMLRLAMIYVGERRAAEDVIQETWIGVLRGLKNFEGRSSFKTWVFSILVNKAKTFAQREGRYVPLEWDTEPDEPTVPEDRFKPADDPKFAHHWLVRPASWESIPEEKLLSDETLHHIQAAIDALPPNQREVITLRDVQHWKSDEVCSILGITEANQRVLLHRARAKVRAALESYLSHD